MKNDFWKVKNKIIKETIRFLRVIENQILVIFAEKNN
jgi:hypothetical protein